MSSKDNESNNVRGKDVSRVGESFNFKKEHNGSARYNENYVFKHEENKITYANAVGENGKEHNDELSSITNDKPDLKKKNDTLDTITKANSAGTIAQSVAIATTTAVVVVVGGGMIVYNQMVDRPQIVQFTEVGAYQNTISFALNIGNSQEQIDSGEPGDECDIVVELTCESYSDFIKTIPVSNYGVVTGTFDGLLYSTEYSLTVYQNELLGLDKTYLLDNPITVVTEDEEIPPEPETSSITLSRSLMPDGTYVYSVTVNYVGSQDYLSDFRLEVFESGSTAEQIDAGEVDPVAETPINSVDGEAEEIEFDGMLEDITYAVALRGLYYNPNGIIRSRAEGSEGERAYQTLYIEEIDFSTIPTSEVPADNYINLSRVVDPVGKYTYGVYVKCDYDVSDYTGFYLQVFEEYPEGNQEELDALYSLPISGVNTSLYIDWTFVFETGVEYYISLVGDIEVEVSIPDSEPLTETEQRIIFTDIVSDEDISTTTVEEINTFYMRRNKVVGEETDEDSYGYKYEGYVSYVDDTTYYQDGFVVYFYAGQSQIGSAKFPTANELYGFTLDMDNVQGVTELTCHVYALSTNPTDLEEHQDQLDSHPEGPVEVELFNLVVDLDEIPEGTTSVIEGISFEFESSYHGGTKNVYALLETAVPLYDYGTDLEIIISQDDEELLTCYLLGLDYDGRVKLDVEDAYDILDEAATSCSVKIIHHSGNDSYTAFSTPQRFQTCAYMTVNGSIKIEREESGSPTAGDTYYLTVYYDEDDYYFEYFVGYKVEFYQASLVDEEWSISPDAMYTETLNSVANTRTSATNGGRWSTTDTYQVKVYGLNSYDEELLLTTEIISFSTL